ncbi:MAG TPA: S-layer homology domain-containing protein, partial [Symbiobacteriaceae bacterium]|nr:S-layer homology domain-containing protein [Symbiobacteriaceae bacterium]
GPAPVKATPEQIEQARAAAVAVVQTYLSSLRPHLRMRPDPMPQYGPERPVASFNFVRYVGGIPVLDEAVSVNIDLNTMAWQEFSVTWSEGLEFPSPEGIVTPDQAEARFFAGRAPRLVYQAKYDNTWFPEKGGAPVHEAGLVYQLWPLNGSAVDARTGELLDWGGQAPGSYEAARKGIAGHWAEGELRFLLGRGLVSAADLSPEGRVTRLMGVRLVQSAGIYRSSEPWRPQYAEPPYTDVARESPAFGEVMNAFQQGWLRPAAGETEFRPDAPLTRAEFIVWVARAVGLGELARSEVAVRYTFTDGADLTVEQRNAALFLQALGILAKGDQLRGSDPITQAEAAAIIVRTYNKQLDR